jgi:ABC-type branched-subunit amino acid transport system substrate-binding protein
MQTRLIAIVTIAVLSLTGFSGFALDTPQIGAWETCATPENLPATVEVGLVADITGAISFYGAPQRDGVEMAVAEINAAWLSWRQ